MTDAEHPDLFGYRRDRTAVGWAATLTVVLSLLYMFLYNALVIPLFITFLGIGLLWRNDQARRLGAGSPAPATVPAVPAAGTTDEGTAR